MLVRRSFSSLAGLAFALVSLAGCASEASSAPAPTAVGPTSDAPPAVDPASQKPALDHGSVSTKYPAFAPSMPRLVHQGGAVLKAPHIITIVYDGDPNAAAYEKLADEIGASAYWSQVVSEYGVGAASSAATSHVRMGAQPALTFGPNTAPEEAVQAYVLQALEDTATSHWPEPKEDVIYTLFFHGDLAQSMCADGMGGFHASVDVKGKTIAYALVLACDGDPKMSVLDGATVSASHEWAEAATDPYPEAKPVEGLGDDDPRLGAHGPAAKTRTATSASSTKTPTAPTAPRPSRRWCSASGRTRPPPPATRPAFPLRKTRTSTSRSSTPSPWPPRSRARNSRGARPRAGTPRPSGSRWTSRSAS
ncbi:MAG: hypothetical protein U0235_23990 [Polyangiaceae bacterium]